MATDKCPVCESPCIIKIVATDDARWCEVDVCQICGAMYPRGRKVVQVKPKKKAKPKAAKKKSKR